MPRSFMGVGAKQVGECLLVDVPSILAFVPENAWYCALLNIDEKTSRARNWPGRHRSAAVVIGESLRATTSLVASSSILPQGVLVPSLSDHGA